MNSSMPAALVSAFRYWRKSGFKAAVALRLAREDATASRRRYPRRIGAMGAPVFKIGSDKCFWCEAPDEYLRRVGFADEVSRAIRHNGWFLDDSVRYETARGVVFQLPAKNGNERFMYGVDGPFSDGPAILSLDIASDKEDAARRADALAERYAENERERNEAYRAADRYAELGEEAAAARRRCLGLIREAKAHYATLRGLSRVKAVICAHVNFYRTDIANARSERARLLREYGRHDAFKETVSEAS